MLPQCAIIKTQQVCLFALSYFDGKNIVLQGEGLPYIYFLVTCHVPTSICRRFWYLNIL